MSVNDHYSQDQNNHNCIRQLLIVRIITHVYVEPDPGLIRFILNQRNVYQQKFENTKGVIDVNHRQINKDEGQTERCNEM